MEDQILYEQQQRSNKLIRLTLQEYCGKIVADLREFYKNGDEWKHTTRGIALSDPAIIDDLSVVFEGAAEKLVKLKGGKQ